MNLDANNATLALDLVIEKINANHVSKIVSVFMPKCVINANPGMLSMIMEIVADALKIILNYLMDHAKNVMITVTATLIIHASVA
jgi:hypothetical protein